MSTEKELSRIDKQKELQFEEKCKKKIASIKKEATSEIFKWSAEKKDYYTINYFKIGISDWLALQAFAKFGPTEKIKNLANDFINEILKSNLKFYE